MIRTFYFNDFDSNFVHIEIPTSNTLYFIMYVCKDINKITF